MVRKAYYMYEKDGFTAPKLFHELDRCKKPRFGKANAIGVQLYEWYKQQPSKARKTRRAFYGQLKVLNSLEAAKSEAEGKAPELVNLNARKRKHWLRRWAKRYNVSFRAVNKKFKLSNAERVKRLGAFWRDVIRVRMGLAYMGVKTVSHFLHPWLQLPLETFWFKIGMRRHCGRMS